MKYIPSYCSTASFPQELPLSALTENLFNPVQSNNLVTIIHICQSLQDHLLDLQEVTLPPKLGGFLPSIPGLSMTIFLTNFIIL